MSIWMDGYKCVCMYVHFLMYMYVCMYVCMYYICLCICMHVIYYVRMYVHVCMCIIICMFPCMYGMYKCTLVCPQTRMHTGIYACIFIHAFKYSRPYTPNIVVTFIVARKGVAQGGHYIQSALYVHTHICTVIYLCVVGKALFFSYDLVTKQLFYARMTCHHDLPAFTLSFN